ncbi:metallophosphoesterase [Escherichia coli]|nr:metallophosphoesterase [Escherichia coli]EIH0674019.1 metallophosphoesterase [Escherichia coli]
MTFVAISDTHLHNWSQFAIPTESGINSRLLQILKAIEEAACAADYHAPAGVVPTVYHGGDLFHVRGSLTPSVLNAVLDFFKTIHRDYGVRFRMIAGNHDLETKDSCPTGNAAAALNSLPFVEVVSEKTLFEDHKVALLPWRDSMDDLRADLAHVKDAIGASVASKWTAIIHAPVNGVVLGIPDHGFDGKELASYGFGLVLAGHYHNHKKIGTVANSRW